MSSMEKSRDRESRHLWVGGLPDDVGEGSIKDFFARFGKIEGVKILPQKFPNIGVAAFVDFFDVKGAIEAKEAKLKWNGSELRANFKFDKNEGSGKPQEKQDGKTSVSSTSDSDSGSSSSSSSSGSGHDTSSKKRRKSAPSTAGGGGNGGPLFIKVTGMADRPERVLQDGLYYEFCRYSTDVMVRMFGRDSDIKWAIIKYKRVDRCREAFSQCQGLMLFGSNIKLTLMDVDDFPPGGRDLTHMSSGQGDEAISRQCMLDDLDPQATRSLFVGNIPKHINVYDLRDTFLRYGNVLDVEIKKMGGSATYGFILYYDLLSAVTARQYMDGHNMKGNTLRVGFGKGTASKQLWIDGIDQSLTEAQLERNLSKYGKIMRIGVDRHRCCSMVQYGNMDSAKEALTAIKGSVIGSSRKLMADFANRDARAAFFSRMDSGEMGMPGHRDFPGLPMPMYGSDMHGGGRSMMMPQGDPGMHGGMMGRGGYGPPHGPHHPHMDYYYHHPYGMDSYYGGGGERPPYGPPGVLRYPSGPYGRDASDDYDDELRAFSRKREREREKRIGRNRHQHDSSSRSGESSMDDRRGGSREEEEEDEEGGSHGRKKKGSKNKEHGKRSSRKPKKKDISGEDEADSEEEQREEARLKATRKSRDLREKLKKRSLTKKRKVNMTSEEDVSEEDDVIRKHDAEEGTHRRDKRKRRIKHPVVAADNKDTAKRRTAQSKPSSSTPELLRNQTPPPKTTPTKKCGRMDELEIEEGVKVEVKSPQQIRDNEKCIEEKQSPRSHDISKTRGALSRDARNGSVTSEKVDEPKQQPKQQEPKLHEPKQHEPKQHEPKQHEPKQHEPKQHEELTVKEETNDNGAGSGGGEDDGNESYDDDSKNSHGHGSTWNTITMAPDSVMEKPSSTIVEETPQSPVMSTNKSSSSPHLPAVGSDLSSGDDFKEEGSSRLRRSKERLSSRLVGGKRGGDSDHERRRQVSPVRSSRHRPQTPDYPMDEADWKGGSFPRTPPLTDKLELMDVEDRRGGSNRVMGESSRNSRKLPRRYQSESSGEVMMGGGGGGSRRDGGSRYREIKEPRQERRYHGGQQPLSPSPPPHPSHMGRKRYHHSPPQPHTADKFDRRRPRGRPYSPGSGGGGGGSGFQRRRSPTLSSPSHRAKSPYGGSPPHSRGRSPIPRSRGARYRYEASPPFEGQQRPKYPVTRGRVSPSSPPHHRYPHSPTPPPPRNTARSPPARRYVRRRSCGSVSPPRVGRGSRRVERSPPPPEYVRASPRPPMEDRYDSMKRHGKRPVYSPVPPSPKEKYRDSGITTGKEIEHPDPKRRRVEESRPKSPSVSPPPPRDSSKSEPVAKIHVSRQQATHHGSQAASDQRGTKASVVPCTLHRPQAPPNVPTAPETIVKPCSSSSSSSSSTLPSQPATKAQSNTVPPQENSLINLLRRYPVMWQGHLMLKNDAAAVQLHFLSGNVQLAHNSLPRQTEQRTPILRISQRMRLEKTQLDGVDRRIQVAGEHCLLLALPCGKDASDVHTQTNALKSNLINYLLLKQAAGIINVLNAQGGGFVLHIFPPCTFSQSHLSRVAPDLLSSASDNCHLMIVVATL